MSDNRMRRWPASLLTACLLMPAGFAPGVFAQDEQEQAELDRVQVTGSRIRRSAVEGQSPILTISRSDIQATGLSSVADVLQEMTTGGSALNTKLNSSGNFGFPPDGSGVGAGSATVDLRHLGSKRVLVLVDGLRWVNESSASGVSSFVDLNTIPLAMVDRIEVLEDGASSIYGNDAIGGVVNVITRSDFEGAELQTSYGQYDEGDGETWQAELSLGGQSDRLRYFFSVSGMDQSEVNSRDRAISSLPVPNTGLTRGSSGTPRGRFIFADPGTGDVYDITLRQPVPGVPDWDPADPFGPNSDYQPFTNDDRYNYAEYNLLLTPNKRTSFFTNLNYELNDSVELWVRALYNERESRNRAAPEPLFLGNGAGTGGLADSVSIDATNPYNPFGYTLDGNSNLILLGRRPIENGPRIFDQDVTTRYLAGGLRGDFALGSRYYFWDVNLIDARSRADQRTQGSFNIARIADALGPVDTCLNDIPGCVPLNLFGGVGSITPDMLDFITFTGQDVSEQNLSSISANLSGDIAELPAGMMGFAGGVEYRELSGFYQPDSVIVAGESNGVPSSPTSGEYDVTEFYGEVIVPLLAGRTGFEQLDLSAAVRHSDFSTFGNETTAKLGLRWQVSEDFLLRATWAEGFRAPGIGELFGSISRFDAVLADLCSDFLNSGASQAIIDNCVALGVPADGSFTQVNPQISISTGGNEALEPETSESYTAGFVYSPSWIDDMAWANRLDLSLTWYQHELDDAIQAIDAQTQLNGCIRTLNPTLCNGIGRSSSGAINQFNNQLTNIGGIETSGVDVNIDYVSPEWSWGRVDVAWKNSFVTKYDELLLDPNDPGRLVARPLEGLEENDGAIPEWQSNLFINWSWGDWQANWTVRLIDGVTESCSDFLDGTPNSLTNLGLCSDPDFDDNTNSKNSLGTTVYNNVQFGWQRQMRDYGLSLNAGVRNLFDREPPTCYSCSLNGFDVTTHELPGRFFYLRAGVTF
ncbi:TonB-dependent receptor plug domain-containing protein [Wenzhouxiangella marina]|uniref:TonB-dependent receptor n=1 Tax=Wenzhouxiangella marina TaxID=1579979 RepID=A0A0K0XUX9_9GAMM|nr:TonB-dependent receptor [Wenzhouxiangella marina]AKS41426.1 TonB-dependent receptor [Wenzhouxiangella marina]MBB6086820.1 iron complex outermembrane receptor protein [Wenzhouxiangella marina]